MVETTPTVVHPFTIPIRLGPLAWDLSGFGLAVLFAFLIAQVVAERELSGRGHEHEARQVADVLFAAVAGTLVGGKLYFVAVITHDWHDLFSRAGFVFWGGFIGAVLACWITIRARKLSFARYADVAGIAIAAGYAVGRTGCWAVGDDYGKWYEGPFAVAFPQGIPPSTVGNMAHSFHVSFPASMAPMTLVGVVPTQLIETILGLAMFAILWRIRRHQHREGWLFGVYAVLAGIERFGVEFLRAKDDRFFALSVAQCIALAVLVSGVFIVRATWRQGTRPGTRAASAVFLIGALAACGGARAVHGHATRPIVGHPAVARGRNEPPVVRTTQSTLNVVKDQSAPLEGERAWAILESFRMSLHASRTG